MSTYFGWMKRWDGIALLVVSMALALGSYTKVLPFGALETVGAITGLISVWLTAKVDIANWPIGLINSATFLWLFWDFKLYGSMAMQVPYLLLGVYGWYMWGKPEGQIARLSGWLAVKLVVFTIIATGATTVFFQKTADPAPFMDAFTTVLSIVALYLLTIKVIQTWFVWITADLIFIYMYWQNDLKLTAVLYMVFLSMCVYAYRAWKIELEQIDVNAN